MRTVKVIRFMSFEESMKFLDGKMVHNYTGHHEERHARTNSVGACFMVVDARRAGMAYHTARYLSNIVSFEVMLVATIDVKRIKAGQFKDGWGIYANYDDLPDYLIQRRELSTTSYDMGAFVHWSVYTRDLDLEKALPGFIAGRLAHAWDRPQFKMCACSPRICEYKTVRIES